jgi:Ca2+-binding EF-hand superfamily protein
MVYVGLACDLNLDGRVDMKDIGITVKAFGSTPQTPNWNPNIDINNDNKIDMKDIGIAVKNFGKTDP